MMTNNNTRLMPQSAEAELAVLGSIFIDNDSYFEVADVLKAADFQNEVNRSVYKIMGGLLMDKRSVDVVTLSEAMKAKGINPAKDSVEVYVIGLMNATPSSVGVRDFADIVKATATRRRLIRAAQTVANLAYDENQHIDTVTGQSEKALLTATDSMVSREMTPVSDPLMDVYDLTLSRREKGGKIAGLATGYTALDTILRGIPADNMVVLAARPGMGKSALAGAMAVNLARRGKRVLIFNMEMGREQITYRLMSSLSKLALTDIIEGRLNDEQWKRFGAAMGELSKMPIYIDDTPSLTPIQLRAKARRQMARGGVDLIIVDYLQLMEGDGRHQNDNSRVAYISRQMKTLSMEVAPVLALAQLNRSVEARQDRHPQLSDLRDSGAIEQDADKVLFLYRDEYYKRETSAEPNIAEIEVAKNRQGKTGMAKLFFHKPAVTFANLDDKPIEL